MIVWLENPVRFSYLRKTPYMSLSSRFPAKTIGRRLADFARLIGYELIGKDRTSYGVSIYHFEFYWLKKHDRDIAPAGVYAGPPWYTGHMPCEAINPIPLVMVHPFVPEVLA